MRKILIMGNSGSGKSTLAKKICSAEKLAHLDLDGLAWLPATPPARRPLPEARQDISEFMHCHTGWVIEGCYTDLLEVAIPQSTELIYMNLPITACIANARRRPWEPHKYPSKAAQDANLEMLVEWIAQYNQREDTFSERAHNKLYANYCGKKTMYTSNLHPG